MSVESIVTKNLDIWTSATKTKSASGRGSSSKFELYGIKKLRELILRLAVQGKLVPQDLDDEPAAELLLKIEAKNNHFVESGKIPKKKKLPPPKKTDLKFEIPNTWTFACLNQLISISSGKNLTSSKMNSEGGVPVFGGNGIAGYHDTSNVNKRTLVIGRVGYYCGSIHITPSEAWVTDNAFITTFAEEYIDINFLSLLLNTTNLKENDNATAQPVISGRKIYPIVVPLPPYNEQIRIVTKVDELMTICDQLESHTEANMEAHQTLVKSLLETLTNAKDADVLKDSWQRISAHFDVLFITEDSIDQLKQTILQLAVMGKLVKQDPNDEPTPNLLKRMVGEEVYKARNKNMSHTIAKEHISFELPSGWSFCNIEQLLDGSRKGMITGPFGSALKKSEHKESGIPVWGIESVKKGKFTGINKIFVDGEKAKELSSFKAIQGDLIISRSGTIDEICVIPDGVEDGLISTNLLRVTLDKKLIEPEFFCFTFKGSEIVLNKIKDMCSGTTRLFLNQKILKSITFPVPPLCEQKKIICKVEELFSVCEEVKAKVRKANDLQNFLADSISSSFVN